MRLACGKVRKIMKGSVLLKYRDWFLCMQFSVTVVWHYGEHKQNHASKVLPQIS